MSSCHSAVTSQWRTTERTWLCNCTDFFVSYFVLALVIDGPLTFLGFLIMQGSVIHMIIIHVHNAYLCCAHAWAILQCRSIHFSNRARAKKVHNSKLHIMSNGLNRSSEMTRMVKTCKQTTIIMSIGHVSRPVFLNSSRLGMFHRLFNRDIHYIKYYSL